jgi:L-fuconolactonase
MGLVRREVAERIDAHHHLWHYSPHEFEWLNESMAALRRNFLPRDLVREITAAGIDGTVVVQARQTIEETRWLLQQAEACAAIRGVVGWAPIAAVDFPGVMEEFASVPKLKGLRHVLQDEEDENYILREDFNSGIRAMIGRGWVYDLLIYERQLPQAIQFVEAHPGQVFVLDHMAKPLIAAGQMQPWREKIRELSKRENVWCKVSGMVTEADWSGWTAKMLRPYLDVVVEAFGVERLMAGSDWPVCLVASDYGRWFGILRDYFSSFSETERDAVFGVTAAKVYGLE